MVGEELAATIFRVENLAMRGKMGTGMGKGRPGRNG
jgi:hypothetical protein